MINGKLGNNLTFEYTINMKYFVSIELKYENDVILTATPNKILTHPNNMFVYSDRIERIGPRYLIKFTLINLRMEMDASIFKYYLNEGNKNSTGNLTIQVGELFLSFYILI